MGRARTNKRGSLNHQINQRMQSLNCIGESRQIAKQEAREELGYRYNRTVGIHSYKTFETYKNSCKQFTSWVKENYEGIRNIEDVKEEHIKDYIKHRENEGCSAYTYSKDLAALNKVFNYHITKQDCDVANRSYTDITNNREMKEHHNHINYDNYKSEITVLQSTGMRRESLEKVSPSSFNYDDKGYPVSIRLIDERAYGGVNMAEKGGREREAEIPYNMREEMKQVIDTKLEENDGDIYKPMFDYVPTRLGTHRFRQEYAENTYKSYLEEYGEATKTLEDTDIKGYEENENTTFRGYDVGALYHTTKMLGHNRLEVVVYNYLKARD